MEEYYFSYEDIKQFFEKEYIDKDILEHQKIAYYCITELIYAIEQVKKGQLKTFADFKIVLQKFYQLHLNPLLIDADNIAHNLLIINEDDVLSIDKKYFHRHTDPRYSACVVSAKLNDASYWGEETYLQILEYIKIHNGKT